ncbi:MAG: four helix bundle protein [Patescibacteria group bacterium]|nr:four helix bundle protein [Patescibacteria group bacterium]
MEDNRIRSFTDLNAWKEGHSLVLFIYEITENFPDKERFGLTSQIRRAAVSITSNISEGFNRESMKEKIQFYSIARGSLAEVQNQSLIAKDIGFLDEENFNKAACKTIITSKLLSGLIKSLKKLV